MLIINADDWGRSAQETDAAMGCYSQRRITSVTAMVFMKDSERAANLAKTTELNVGLHLNFSDVFTSEHRSEAIAKDHQRIRRFLKRSKYALVLYNPFLRQAFHRVYRAQVEEFIRLYGRPPTHVDGHQHMHLCSNVLVDRVIPRGQKVRRSFSFWPGEKCWLNRLYRRVVDRRLATSYRVTDYFFDLSACLDNHRLGQALGFAKVAEVELMTHPKRPREYSWLTGSSCSGMIRNLKMGSYAMLGA